MGFPSVDEGFELGGGELSLSEYGWGNLRSVGGWRRRNGGQGGTLDQGRGMVGCTRDVDGLGLVGFVESACGFLARSPGLDLVFQSGGRRRWGGWGG